MPAKSPEATAKSPEATAKSPEVAALSSSRRRESIALALLAIASIVPLRWPVESTPLLLAEYVLMVVWLAIPRVLALWSPRFGGSGDHTHGVLAWQAAALLAACTPIGFAIVARQVGQPIAFEISFLATFGASSLALAVLAGSTRTRGMSIVVSGFLVLFATSISDDPKAFVWAVAWLGLCVWHMVANHWDKLDVCMPVEIQRSVRVRPMSVVVAVGLAIAGGLFAQGRFGPSNRFDFGVMPTSGGSNWSDSAARSGIGDGDAAVAAKDHAESFGAVDSDIYLESTESSLYDMFNDMLGEPTQKPRWERRQAVGGENLLSTHEQAAKTEQGGGSFSTDRMPPREHRHLRDKRENAVVQWAGPTGIRLAMHRFDSFDGLTWTRQAGHESAKMVRRTVGDQAWFFRPDNVKPADRDRREASLDVHGLKILRLRTTHLPVPMLAAGVHIKDVDRGDFFGVDVDGSMFMPGRETIPPLTVIDVACGKLLEDELWSGLEYAKRPQSATSADAGRSVSDSGSSVPGIDSPSDWRGVVRRQARRVTRRAEHPYEKLTAILDHLRHNFRLERADASRADASLLGEPLSSAGAIVAASPSGRDAAAASQLTHPSPVEPHREPASAVPLIQFLNKRRGGDHLFATAAALMAREVGLTSRLVTGLYVRPGAWDFAAGHANVARSDVHVWAEIRLDDGRWFAVEPAPGYRRPGYAPSLWLRGQRFAVAYWPIGVTAVVTAAVLFFTRLVWINACLRFLWCMSALCSGRRQVGLAMRIVETRARLVGRPRPAYQPQRDWLESVAAEAQASEVPVTRFCDVADRAIFGDRESPERQCLDRFVRGLSVDVIRRAGDATARRQAGGSPPPPHPAAHLEHPVTNSSEVMIWSS